MSKKLSAVLIAVVVATLLPSYPMHASAAPRPSPRPTQTGILHDVGVDAIFAPSAFQDTYPFAPYIRVQNYGDSSETFQVYFRILASLNGKVVYSESLKVSGLSGLQSDCFVFPSWNGHHTPGQYSATAWTELPDDANHGNDTATLAFEIKAHLEPSGMRPDLPPGPRGKSAGPGECVVWSPETDTGFVYALKGNNTLEFYRYDLARDTWVARKSLPFAGASGRDRYVKDGAALAALHGKVYAVKGSWTNDIFCYDPKKDSWSNLPSVPGVPIRGGCSMVSIRPGGRGADTLGYLYLLKGSNSREFWRFDFARSQWERQPNAPAGPSGKPYRLGSCITTNDTFIYALKAYYNEFFEYSLAKHCWRTLEPLAGLPKVGSGAAMAATNQGICLILGNGPGECLLGWGGTWVYVDFIVDHQVGDQSFPLIPLNGALCYVPPLQAVFLLNSWGVQEIGWFSSYAAASAKRLNTGPARDSLCDGSPLVVTPNPSRGRVTVSLATKDEGQGASVTVSIHDIAGRTVRNLTLKASGSAFSASADLSDLPKGVYFITREPQAPDFKSQSLGKVILAR